MDSARRPVTLSKTMRRVRLEEALRDEELPRPPQPVADPAKRCASARAAAPRRDRRLPSSLGFGWCVGLVSALAISAVRSSTSSAGVSIMPAYLRASDAITTARQPSQSGAMDSSRVQDVHDSSMPPMFAADAHTGAYSLKR